MVQGYPECVQRRTADQLGSAKNKEGRLQILLQKPEGAQSGPLDSVKRVLAEERLPHCICYGIVRATLVGTGSFTVNIYQQWLPDCTLKGFK